MKKHYLFDSNLYYFFLHFILFFYIYSIQFIGVPFGLGTRVFMGIIGLLVYLLEIFRDKKKLIFSRKFSKILTSLLLIVFISFLSLIYNSTFDIEFLLKYPISIIIIIFASYLVAKLVSFRSVEGNKLPFLMKLFINVVSIQILLALIMFIYPSFRDLLNSLQLSSDYELKVLEETLEFRLVGFGSKFFGSGIVNGFALILIGSDLRFNNQTKTNVLKHAIFFLFIFVFGMMMARTTIIGALFAIVIIFLPKRGLNINLKLIKNNTKFLLYFICIPTIIVLALNAFLPEVKEVVQYTFNFGFEMFINYFQSNSFESESTNQLKEMYVWPTSLKTYIIGDGFFTDVINGTYYMQTDIGILRLIYYFGIIGLFAYLYLQFHSAKLAYSISENYKSMVVIIFLYCIVLNYKGFTDLFFLNILFYFNNIYKGSTHNEKNIISNSF